MAKQQKKIAKIVDAVRDILGDDKKRKKIKKAKAFRRFIDKLEDKRAQLAAEREAGDLKTKQKEALDRKLRILDKQIAKALKILAEMT